MEKKEYGYHVNLRGARLDDAVARVTRELAAEGFGVLSDIDVRSTFKKKLGMDYRGYRILGACNPTLAHRALEVAPQVGLLLPCNVVVEETPGGVHVSIMDPRLMSQVVDAHALKPIVDDADARLRRVGNALSRPAPV